MPENYGAIQLARRTSDAKGITFFFIKQSAFFGNIGLQPNIFVCREGIQVCPVWLGYREGLSLVHEKTFSLLKQAFRTAYTEPQARNSQRGCLVFSGYNPEFE